MIDRVAAIQYLRQLAEGEREIVLEAGIAPTMEKPNIPLTEDGAERAVLLAQIAREAGKCRLCELASSRNKVVPGVGNPMARLMFVGEAPGADEDRAGEPFVGKAGQLLTKIIIAMGFTREEVYIANILKCRPPGNRNPLPHEAAACMPFLRRQIEIIKPELVVALGLVATTHLLDLPPNAALKDHRDRILSYHGTPLIVTYHPAALLRSPALKTFAWQDMQMAMKILKGELSV